jgi:hypothetical protein
MLSEAESGGWAVPSRGAAKRGARKPDGPNTKPADAPRSSMAGAEGGAGGAHFATARARSAGAQLANASGAKSGGQGRI